MARFEKGNKASPGRPRGVPDKRTQFRELFKPHAPELIKVAVDMALSGDAAALRLCLDRIAPTLKPTTEQAPTQLPTKGSLTDQAAELYRQTAAGKIDLDTAVGLMRILTGRIKIDELTTLEERLTELEKKTNK